DAAHETLEGYVAHEGFPTGYWANFRKFIVSLSLGLVSPPSPLAPGPSPLSDGRWLMMSDVCKHCVTAPCQQACPTGAIIHNEFVTAYIQADIGNGRSYR